MALLHSSPLCHSTTPPSTTSHNNKLINSSMLASKHTKSIFHFTRCKKLSSSTTSSSSFSVRCSKAHVLPLPVPLPLPIKPDEDVVNDLGGLGLAPTSTPKLDFQKKEFPPDFLFGASTSAMQTEGPPDEGGRGKGCWDSTLQGKDAVRSYQLYSQDVERLKDMGMNTYRFSISWPRILPKGTIYGGVNREGVEFYDNLINLLLENGIQPMVTLLHFDIPQALHDKYKSFLNPQFVEDFKEYADLCFKLYGDRVKIWGTINEPFIFVHLGKKMNLPPELQTDPLATKIAYHNIILAHSAAAKHYQLNYKESQDGKIGISLPIQWSMPYNPDDPTDVAAADAARDIQIGWFMNPLVYGDYPEWIKKHMKGLPVLSDKDKEMVKGAFDYIGINYYTSRYFKSTFTLGELGSPYTTIYDSHTHDVDGNDLGKPAKGRDDIYDYPEGLRQLLVHMKNKYGDPELYITENGTSQLPDTPASIENLIQQGNYEKVEEALYDYTRIHYTVGHLKASLDAIREGVKLKGYVAWALIDNMEMGRPKPYDVRFGLNFVDYHDNYRRIPKKSAMWFKKFLKEENDKAS